MSLKTKIESLLGKWLRKLLGKLLAEAPAEAPQQETPAETPQPAPAETPQTQPANDADAVPFGDLDFRWGGFNGSGATLADGCRIDRLKVSGNGLSYDWWTGGCEQLGASSAGDADCLACLFCRIGGKWQGGKFDWISTSRRSRGFENIHGGYNGWDPDAIGKADAYAFVIVSRNGKLRSNVIAQGV